MSVPGDRLAMVIVDHMVIVPVDQLVTENDVPTVNDHNVMVSVDLPVSVRPARSGTAIVLLVLLVMVSVSPGVIVLLVLIDLIDLLVMVSVARMEIVHSGMAGALLRAIGLGGRGTAHKVTESVSSGVIVPVEMAIARLAQAVMASAVPTQNAVIGQTDRVGMEIARNV